MEASSSFLAVFPASSPVNLLPTIILSAISISLFTPNPHPSPSPLCHSRLSVPPHRNKISLFSGRLSSSSLLFSALITLQTNPAITLTLPTPVSCLKCALHRREVGGGVGLTSGDVPLRRQRLRHGETLLASAEYSVRHKDTCFRASSHPRSSSERLASRLAEHKKRLNFFFLRLATPRARPNRGLAFVS